MKVWITKYALTDGIIECEGKLSTYPGGILAQLPKGSYLQSFYNRDWMESEAEAKADAERRRDERIASLRKQIAKLEKLEF